MKKEFTKSYAIKRIAELTEQIEEWRSLYSALMKDCQMQIEEYNKIKNQLAEKEEKIAILKQELSDKESKWAKFSQTFAVEQLEKVKDLCKNKFEWWENSEWEGHVYDKSDVSNAYFDIEANIDNQIAKLKKVKI